MLERCIPQIIEHDRLVGCQLERLFERRPSVFPIARLLQRAAFLEPEQPGRAIPRTRDRGVVHPRRFGIAFGVDELVAVRSEEHTSELQSLMRISYAVFCLKKQKLIKSKVCY